MSTFKRKRRSSLIAGREINLNETEPIVRLKQLCRQGKYQYEMLWDKFQNGIMISCELYFLNQGRRKPVDRVVQFVETDQVYEAQKTIAVILLDNIGLGVDPGSEEELDMGNNMAMGMKAVTGLISKFAKDLKPKEGGSGSWADAKEE